MKRLLLTGLLSAAILGASAAAPLASGEKKSAAATVKPIVIKTGAPQGNLKRLAPGVTETVSHGIKKLNKINGTARIRKPSRILAKSPLPEGMAFFESFEDWDGSQFWIPEGWELDHRGNCSLEDSWTPEEGSPYLVEPVDGKYMYAISYSYDNQDEWLITPEIKIEENYQFSFWYFLNPLYLFSLENVDWDAFEFTGEKEIAATLQLWAQPAGGEWTMLHDMADDYMDFTLDELYEDVFQGMRKYSVDLDEFAGKNVKFAFRLVGTDGNTMFIDAVGVGFPTLDDVSFMAPFDTMYFGLEPNWHMSYLPADIAQYGVYYPTTWTNLSYNEGATYSWTYEDPKTHEPVTADGEEVQDELTLTFEPDYSSAATLRNNFYSTPVLTASAPGATATEYGMGAPLMQAGGTCEYVFSGGDTFNGAYLP
ncbi:MAG: choice-of-anchor J domain-containing protein, partial [Muribaculaceae bacterium]|nr:choice-of-anchor J domain-containing protein [Muribaculaceae bacterium]